ncbi:MAG: Ig-like domain repeat protein [Verrucomicrobia bacterium]|nr:Ig-like domain repeat protein [Verrucomicrobiota bacterium]
MKTLNRINPIRDYLKHSALAVAMACCLASQAQAQWAYSPWTNDADSGITSASSYTVAVNCNGDAVTVNGVAFQASATSGANFSLGGDIASWGPGGTPNISGGSLTLAQSFFYNGNPRTVTLSNLTPGATYETSLFSFGWEDSGRTQTFASGSDSLVVDQDLYGNQNGIRIAYTFVADTDSKVLTITPGGGGTFHMAALANRQVIIELAVKLASPADAEAIPSGTSVMATANVTDPGAFTHTVTFHTTPISPSGSTVDTVSTDTASPYTADLGTLAAGTYQIHATVVNSDTPAGTATSATHAFTVAPAVPTTTTLASPATPSTYGQNVTFTATVLPTPTGGTVQFFDGGSPLGSPATVNTTSGEATYSSTALGVGTHVITAQYNGYQIYETSTTAASISQVVDQAPLTVTALNMFRTVNTPNPVQFPYQITGYQNGQNLATSGVTGTPVLTTDATLSSPVGNYVITCALGTLAASNYSFTLENGTLTITDLACQLGVLNLGANGGINPATGNPWALGDTYRLIFVTSADTVCDSTDIATYNNFVQGLAVASTSYPKLGSVTWKVVGSTASVDARDNTSTNPSVNGVGEPILRMDGLFVIANNYADLWDGAINSTHVPGQNYLAVAFDENGVERIHERVRTGSSGNGTATSVLGGSGSVQTGRNYAPDFYGGYGGWMQDWGEAAASAGPVYAMSAPLTIQVAPGNTFTSWANANNASGQTPDQDHDNDGVANGIEYFMGQTGSSFTALPGLDATNKVTWTMDPAYQGTYEVQTSPDLVTWTNVDPRPVPAGGNLSYLLPTGLGKQFVRLLVTPTP